MMFWRIVFKIFSYVNPFSLKPFPSEYFSLMSKSKKRKEKKREQAQGENQSPETLPSPHTHIHTQNTHSVLLLPHFLSALRSLYQSWAFKNSYFHIFPYIRSRTFFPQKLWDQPYLWLPSTSLPFGADFLSFQVSFSNLNVTFGVNLCKQSNWPSCFSSYLSDRGHWFHASWTKRYEQDQRPSSVGCDILLFDFDKTHRASLCLYLPEKAFC